MVLLFKNTIFYLYSQPFFTRKGGLKKRLLNLLSLPNEHGKTIAYSICKTLSLHKITSKKIVGICADNCPTNFGSSDRGGVNNVFSLLSKKFPGKIIGIGCLAHVLNNAIKNSANGLLVCAEQLETLLHQIHQHFQKDKTKAIEFGSLAKELGVTGPQGEAFKGLPPAYSRTRWLSLEPAIGFAANNFTLLQFYFNQTRSGKHLEEFREFFENKETFPWLMIIWDLAELFEYTILKLENHDLTLIEAVQHFDKLLKLIEMKQENPTLSELVQVCIHEWSLAEQEAFTTSVGNFYKSCSTYMKKWSKWTDDLECLSWITLEREVTEQQILDSLKRMQDLGHQVKPISTIEIDLIGLNQFVRNHVDQWNQNSVSACIRWKQVFDALDDRISFHSIVELALCLPASNATCERLFSEIKFLWTKNRSSFKLVTIKSILSLRYNLSTKCKDIIQVLVEDEHLRYQIRSQIKYEESKLNKEEAYHKTFFEELSKLPDCEIASEEVSKNLESTEKENDEFFGDLEQFQDNDFVSDKVVSLDNSNFTVNCLIFQIANHIGGKPTVGKHCSHKPAKFC